MNLSSTAQATLLMTSYFSKANKEDIKPLSNSEWGRFAFWLKEQEMTPADLLLSGSEKKLSGWQDTKISLQRIIQLLSRGHSLALAIERWQRAGLWIVTRADKEYPKRLKGRLKSSSPPVIFGCGNKSLLESGGLAVIGSRNANDEDLYYTQLVGSKAANHGITIVSGGARGVDDAAMQGAVNSKGNVIGVLADSLLKAATSKKWRRGLMDGHVVLISPFYPEAGFNAGNAMARNKYIYCLADSSLVIHSGQSGGTLNGAKENLGKQWVPLWVKPTKDSGSANTTLVQSGGMWCDENIQKLDLQSLFLPSTSIDNNEQKLQSDMFTSVSVDDENQGELAASLFSNKEKPLSRDEPIKNSKNREQDSGQSDNDRKKPINFYKIFLSEFAKQAENSVTSDELAEFMGLTKTQINAWLKCAVSDGFVKKLNQPVRYHFIKSDE